MHNLQLSEQEQQAVTVYDERVRSGAVEFNPIWADEFTLGVFVHLPENGEVVDIGCGTGRSISILPNLGISRYLGIDPSAETIAYCRQEYPEHEFAVGSVQTLGREYPGRFSGFIMTACLMHIPRQNLPVAMQSLRASLQAGAQGLISIPFGDGSRLTYSPRSGVTATLYSELEMRHELPLNDLRIRKLEYPGHNMLLLHVEAV